MTQEEYRTLDVGDIVQSPSGLVYTVVENCGSVVVASRTMVMSNPDEWTLRSKVMVRRDE